jgi:cyclic pyranopterin phosphate synthase
MADSISYLRMSITDRCNLRCFYCTYWQRWEKLAAPEILRYEELLRLAAVAGQLGIRKIRVTGGEPLVRRGVVDFIRRLRKIPGIEEICLTTNGVMLAEMAPALFEAGLSHLNVSLDTLRPLRYRRITGRDNLREVLAGLEKAQDLGFFPLKINCVVLKGLNDDELLDLARLARPHPWQVRFIELMPSGSPEEWQRHFLPMAAVRRRLAPLGPLTAKTPAATAGPARIFQAPGFRGELGFISPMSRHHCRTCNRLRLTARGGLRPCLLNQAEIDLKHPLRQGLDAREIEAIFQEAMARKAALTGAGQLQEPFPHHSMAAIGG